ncbi:hypothetical protein [Candidatus Protochlamydia phocaeensis]|uniref:hypothetical protein n=1 Tax=Candidatus Protochlamydia phocaeensis TaxID=1414722 RepID=UPI000AAE1A07|nr:hypothetical protein [Candidatus Protochlamydia phocaeensis]
MNKLKKYELNFDEALNYIKWNLNKTNTLSCELLNLLNFRSGCFFTLISNQTVIENLHNFERGGIFPQQSMKENVREQCYSSVQTSRNEVANMLFYELKRKSNFNCCFDDMLTSPLPIGSDELFDAYGVCYKNDVYYYLQNKDISVDLLKKCFHYSNNGWHSLCVLTQSTLNNNERAFSFNKIQDVALKTGLIILRAYDGEGYVFWERENVSFFD